MKLKKNIVTGISVIIVGSIGFFYSNVSQPPFIHITTGKGLDTHRTDSTYWYIEDILVAHPPKDTLERMKMMINYHDTTGLSLADLKKQGDITFYYLIIRLCTCYIRNY